MYTIYLAPLVALNLTLRLVSASLTYDYVIAGGGTAGLLLAVALTEDSNVTVIVLEAGGDTNITVPKKQGSIQHTQYDWQFQTIP